MNSYFPKHATLEAKKELLSFYERVAAAFFILGAKGQDVPMRVEEDWMGGAVFSRVHSKTNGFGYSEHLHMRDAIQIADQLAPGEIDRVIIEGREKNWDFTASDSCDEPLTATARPMRRRPRR